MEKEVDSERGMSLFVVIEKVFEFILFLCGINEQIHQGGQNVLKYGSKGTGSVYVVGLIVMGRFP